MDLLEIAQRGFEQIANSRQTWQDEEGSDAIERWLSNEVCRAVEQLTESNRFRSIVAWSLSHLTRGSGTPERSLVEAVDAAIVRMASEIAEVEYGRHPEPPEAERALIELIANKPWFDLVADIDFFFAERGIHLTNTRPELSAEFSQGADYRVPYGDYVARLMWRRIDFFAQKTIRFWQNHYQDSSDIEYSVQSRLFTCWAELDEAITRLRNACHASPDSPLRDPCTALVQIYAAYGQNPHLPWLGCTDNMVAVDGHIIRSHVRRRTDLREMQLRGGQLRLATRTQLRLCDPEIVLGIAAALKLVEPIYRRPAETEDLVEWLRQDRLLVLVDGRPRQVFWEGNSVESGEDYWETHKASWQLLWRLALAAQRDRIVTVDEALPPNLQNGRALAARRSRLGQVLPEALNSLIQEVPPRAYRLNLPPHQIKLVALDSNDRQIELGLESQQSTPVAGGLNPIP